MSDAFTEFAPLNYNAEQVGHQGYGMATSGVSEDRLIVAFYPKSVLNVAKSKAEGKRVCETKDYVKIQTPGETLTALDRLATDSDRKRWPRQWALYAQGKEQIPDGIPISLLFPAHPNIVDMLRGYNIHTVEQLANLSGSAIQTVGMGSQDWVNKAVKYLDQSTKGVDFHRFNKMAEEKDRQIATLERQITDLNNRLQQFMNSMQQKQSPQQNYDPNFDVQSSMIANLKQTEEFSQPPISMAATIVSPDLSGEVRTRKQRSDRGKPRGPRKGEPNAA